MNDHGLFRLPTVECQLGPATFSLLSGASKYRPIASLRRAEGEDVKIGIIGTGNMGRALGLRWANLGHEVFFGSRDLAKAESVAAQHAASARTGSFDEAAAFGQVVLYTARDVVPSRLLRNSQVLSGKVVIDCNNRILQNGNETVRHEVATHAEMLAADVPGVRVVKAFNTIAHRVIELSRAQLAPHRVSVYLCSDDSEAKGMVKALAEELGFVGVDCGTLEHSRLVESLFGFVSFQIGAMKLGPYATVSVHVLPAN